MSSDAEQRYTFACICVPDDHDCTNGGMREDCPVHGDPKIIASMSDEPMPPGCRECGFTAYELEDGLCEECQPSTVVVPGGGMPWGFRFT